MESDYERKESTGTLARVASRGRERVDCETGMGRETQRSQNNKGEISSRPPTKKQSIGKYDVAVVFRHDDCGADIAFTDQKMVEAALMGTTIKVMCNNCKEIILLRPNRREERIIVTNKMPNRHQRRAALKIGAV